MRITRFKIQIVGLAFSAVQESLEFKEQVASDIREFSGMIDANQSIETEEEEREIKIDLKTIVGLKSCSVACIKTKTECPFKECKYWIQHSEDHNCDLIAIEKNGEMTLRDVAVRLRN